MEKHSNRSDRRYTLEDYHAIFDSIVFYVFTAAVL